MMRRTQGYKLLIFQIIGNLAVGVIVLLTGILCARYPSSMVTIIASALVLVALMKLFSVKELARVVYWYESLLDAIPFPLSITDKNMKWTFINKPVEGMLGIKRNDILGKHCSNWGAGICNTDNCGVACLKRGKNQTTFEQIGCDFQVDTTYILDRRGRQVCHIEVVQEITKLLKMQKAQTTLFNEISGLSTAFADATNEISSDAQILAQGAAEQAASVTELSSDITNISNQIDINTQQALQATSLARTIQTDAETGSKQMTEMRQAVQEISEAGQSIEKIIDVIDGIAFQTNLLALNAAVEAARAGQHGKGFAVVAEEVRSLASKSAEAAQNTHGLIANTVAKSTLGAQVAGEAVASLAKIIEEIKESGQIVSKISESTQSQNDMIKQIKDEIERISRIVQQNSEAASKSADASEKLNRQTAVLKQLLVDFDNNKEVASA